MRITVVYSERIRGRLREWLGTGRDALRVQRRLSAAAAEWANAGHDPSFLATGSRLGQFAALATSADLALNAGERAFVEASQAAAAQAEQIEAERRERELVAAQQLAAAESARAAQQQQAAARLRRRAYGLAGALTAALVLAGVAFALSIFVDPTAGLLVNLLVLPYWFFVALFLPATKGTTLGKKLMGLAIVTDSTRPGQGLGWGKAFLRLLGYFVSSLAFSIGYLLVAFTSKKQGLHDLIAGTYVVRTR